MITIGTFSWGVFAALYFIFASINNYSTVHLWLGFGLYCILSLIAHALIKNIHKDYLKKPSYGSLINIDNVETITCFTFYAICLFVTKLSTPILIAYNII